jgi:hypothetical protein
VLTEISSPIQNCCWANRIKMGAALNIKSLAIGAIFGLGLLATSPAQAATYTYVGSWEVAQGPSWTTVPTAYSGVEAAALLFGGPASNYVVSTAGSDVNSINFENWISTWGVAGGQIVSDTSVVSTNGLYQNFGDTSAFVNDNAVGTQFTNFAFEITAVPGPTVGAGPASFAFAALFLGWLVRRRAHQTV